MMFEGIVNIKGLVGSHHLDILNDLNVHIRISCKVQSNPCLIVAMLEVLNVSDIQIRRRSRWLTSSQHIFCRALGGVTAGRVQHP